MPISMTKDPSGAPAVDLSKLRADHPDLVKRAEKAGISLSKRGLAGVRAQAALYLDHSGSMHRDYASGVVQTLVERALGFALQIDADGVVPVTTFDTSLWPTVDVGVHNYRDVVNRELWKRGAMGGTLMAPMFEHLWRLVGQSELPVFAVVVGDGSPSDRPATTRIVCELARKPVFVKFLSVRPVDYLQELDDLEEKRPGARLLDNFDTKSMPNPAALTDLEFADAMVDEWDGWIKEATVHGILS